MNDKDDKDARDKSADQHAPGSESSRGINPVQHSERGINPVQHSERGINPVQHSERGQEPSTGKPQDDDAERTGEGTGGRAGEYS